MTTEITAKTADSTATPGPDVAKTVARLRQTFATGKTRSV
jgi:aldehyde dehydrogenase (NAD+)